MNIMMRFLLLAVMIHLLEQTALACVVLPVPQEPAPKALDRATDIGLVRIDEIEKVEDGIRIVFTPLEVLKGDESSLQSVFFRCPRCAEETLDFRVVGHDSVDFFSGADTSLSMMPDCSLIPSARVGEQHLFLNSYPLSRFVLERVSEDDRWLYWAKKYIHRKLFRPITAQEYLLNAESMTVVSCKEWPSHFFCEGETNFTLKVREKSSARIFYPSIDGQCFTLKEEFERRHGFELAGLDANGRYCFGKE